MKLDNVKIFDAVLARGLLYWWTADIRGNDCHVEATQAPPLSVTYADAMNNARIFATWINAEFVEPIETMDPCV